jgi:hypothetical protein
VNGDTLNLNLSSISVAGESLLLGEHAVSLAVHVGETLIASYNWTIELSGSADLGCDFSGDGHHGVLDAVALLLLGHYNPLDPRTDYNRDGVFGADDVLGLLGDLQSGACGEPPLLG